MVACEQVLYLGILSENSFGRELQEDWGGAELARPLLKIPAATKDVKKLKSLYDACEGYIYGLESLDVYPECYGYLLIPIVMKKLPEEVRCIVLRSHDETPWSLADLRKQLRLVLEIREKSSLGQSDKEVSAAIPLLIPSFLQLVTSLVPWEEKTQRKNVCSVLFFL